MEQVEEKTNLKNNKINENITYPHFPQILNHNRVKLFKQAC